MFLNNFQSKLKTTIRNELKKGRIKMKIFHLFLMSIISICLLSFSAYPQIESFNPEKSRISIEKYKPKSKIDSTGLDSIITSTMNQYYLPGVATAIFKKGQVIWNKNYGYRDVDNFLDVNDSTSFLLASASKTVTGLALMQLWEQGLFNLDDDINGYLPSHFQIVNPMYPNDIITFRHLLTHTSSIDRDDQLLLNYISWGNDSPIAIDSFLVEYLMPGGQHYNYGPYNNYAPGTQWQYSNHVYALIGYLVEILSGIDFPNYCQINIFGPLDMNETAWYKSGLDTNNLAIPYTWDNVNFVPYGYYGNPDYPCGWLKSSSSDLINYISAFTNRGQFNGYTLLDSSTIDLMNTIQYPSVAPFMGLTWIVSGLNGLKVCEHSGGLPGCVTYINYSPTNDFGIIALSNGEPWDGGLNSIIFALFEYALTHDEIYANQVEVNSSYLQTNVDSLIVQAQYNNPYNHNFTPYAILSRKNFTKYDSIRLYDDGLHNDSLANDGIWGNIFPSIDIENAFYVDISTMDMDNGRYLYLNGMAQVTTIGPITVDDYYFYGTDTIPHHGDQSLKFKLVLRNNGISALAPEVSAFVTSMDSSAFIRLTDDPTYGDIPPGSTVATNGHYRINFNDVIPDSIYIPFNVEIASEDYLYWSDTIFVFVHKDPTGIDGYKKNPESYLLSQNYPNPFNPVTNIKFQIPKTEYVTLKIYNTLGKQVETLVGKSLIRGTYNYVWDASGMASGVYFYKIEAGNYIEINKMIYIK
jgi:CubicO group peptidase (beta-lactamase class C family)